MNDHHLKVQFNNTIEDVVQPQAQAHTFDSRYCTLHTDRASSKLSQVADRHQRRLKNRINVILGEDTKSSSDQFSGRKSLVDLYDNSLNLVL